MRLGVNPSVQPCARVHTASPVPPNNGERGVSHPLTDLDQDIPDNMSSHDEMPDSITTMVRAYLADNADSEPEQAILAKTGIKIPHPAKYAGEADLEEFETFIANILRWLSMNKLLGTTSTQIQIDYLGTRLKGEASEWFYRNAE